MTNDPSHFGPGHSDVARVLQQARTLTREQAFALREDREGGTSLAWLGLHAYTTRSLASKVPEVGAWVDAAQAAAESAVWTAANAWGGEPLDGGWGRSLFALVAQDAAIASAFAARSAVLAAVTAPLIDGWEGAPTPSEHATLAAAWAVVFPVEGDAE